MYEPKKYNVNVNIPENSVFNKTLEMFWKLKLANENRIKWCKIVKVTTKLKTLPNGSDCKLKKG